jgi:genome maintenance exonuclease 1
VEGKRHYLTPSGKKLPSMTTVLGSFEKAGIIKWRKKVGEDKANSISKRASIRGTGFHKIIENYVGNKHEGLLKDQMPDMVEAFRDIRSIIDRIDNVHYLEASLFSELVGVAGCCDCIAEFDGIPSVIDYKTSLKPKKEEWIQNYFEQATGYSLLYQDMTGIRIPQIVVIIAVDYEEPQIFVKQRKNYVESLYEKIKTYYEENRL